MEDRTVFVFGQSMLLLLVANSLADIPNLHVIQATSWKDLEICAANFTPDVLIYDLLSSPESALLPLLYKNPHLQLIGLDVETNRAVLIAGQETKSLTLERVKEIVGKPVSSQNY